jgi:hypothetical protein
MLLVALLACSTVATIRSDDTGVGGSTLRKGPGRGLREAGDALEAPVVFSGTSARFTEDGLALGGEGPRLRFAAWGRDGARRAVEPVAPVLGDCAVESTAGDCRRPAEYHRDGITEWWLTYDDGVEWGWTLDAPPSGEGLITLETEIQNFTLVDDNGGGVDASGRKWFVGEAVAWDADGQTVPVWQHWEGNRLVVEVDATEARWPVVVDPTFVSPSEYIASSTSSSATLSGGGDVNGDGYADVLVWSQKYVGGAASYNGVVDLFLGGAAGVSTSPATTLTGTGGYFGYAMHGGDVNGDGYGDVAIGDFQYKCSSSSYCGALYVYYGSSSGLSASPGTSIYGSSQSPYTQNFGMKIGNGDYNGDGRADFAVYGYAYTTASLESYFPRISVYNGSSSGLSTTASINLDGSASSVWGSTDYFGGYLGPNSSCDINGDGYDDLIIDAVNYQYKGLVNIYFGSTSGLTSSPGWTRSGTGSSSTEFSQVSGSCLGDVTGDTLADVQVATSTYSYSLSADSYATTYNFQLYSGSASGPVSTLDMGGNAYQIGDTDGDSIDDVYLNGLVQRGSSSGPDDSSAYYLAYGADGERLGDLNGDGYDDMGFSNYIYFGFADHDADGIVVGGDAGAPQDCDDNDATIGLAITRYVDADLDGYGSTVLAVACPGEVGYADIATDCDDSDPARSPGATEVCDSLNVDEDCDGLADDTDPDAVYTAWYRDFDGDNHGDAGSVAMSCEEPIGYSSVADDCDDGEPSSYPGNSEVCDGVDNDCSGGVDEGLLSTWYHDGDGDGHGDSARTTEACAAPLDYVSTSDDCDDTETTVYPGAEEACDGLDNDCSGDPDDGLGQTWYRDTDGDGHGDPERSVVACEPPLDYVSTSDDCDDNAKVTFPGAEEKCDELDNNCNTSIDEDVDCPSDDDLAIAEKYPPKSGCATSGGAPLISGLILGFAAMALRQRRRQA